MNYDREELLEMAISGEDIGTMFDGDILDLL